MRRLFRAATMLALALATTATVLTAGVSGASASSGTELRLSPDSNFFLFVEVRGASNSAGAGVDQWNFTGGNNQVWRFEPHANHYWIRNKQSGLSLASDGVAGDTVFQWYCGDASPTELWDYNYTANTGIGYP